MKQGLLLSVLCVACASSEQASVSPGSAEFTGEGCVLRVPAQALLTDFYKDYLSQDGTKPRVPRIHFSKSFQSLINANKRLCDAKAGTDVCGWGANGDVFLNTQESDPKLTYENSEISITEAPNSKLIVVLNVYPSLKSKKDRAFYTRRLSYLTFFEEDRWVVDDILMDDKFSAREAISREMAELQKR